MKENKKETAQEVRTQEQLKKKIENGEMSINQARIERGLPSLNDELANTKITKVLSGNNRDLD